MKKIIYVFLFVLGLSCLSSCSQEQGLGTAAGAGAVLLGRALL